MTTVVGIWPSVPPSRAPPASPAEGTDALWDCEAEAEVDGVQVRVASDALDAEDVDAVVEAVTEIDLVDEGDRDTRDGVRVDERVALCERVRDCVLDVDVDGVPLSDPLIDTEAELVALADSLGEEE